MASVKKAGDYYEIVSITTNDQQYLDDGGYFIPINFGASIVVVAELNKGNMMFVKSDIKIEITEHDLVISIPDEIENERLRLLHKARTVVTLGAATLRGFDFFEFTITNNYLASKGVFITDDNREEVYIGIINSGDDKTIEYLEKYLNALDRISIPYYQYNIFLDFESDVLEAKTLDELKELENNYKYF